MSTTSHELRTVTGQTFDVQLDSAADIASFFVFSLHKAGSTLLNKMLSDVCKNVSIPFFAPEQEEFDNGVPIGTLDNSVQRLLTTKGYCFAGFRSFPRYLDGLDLRQFKKIFLIRDPRDMVVSHYFSLKISHPLPPGELGKKLRAIRASLESKTIDQYALESAPMIQQRYTKYQESIFDDNLKLFRYEDVIFNKQTWLADVLKFAGINADPEMIKRIADQQDVRPPVEDPNNHIRKVTPGDHKNKLQPATIAQLNDIFSDQLERFRYPLDAVDTTAAA